MANTGLKHAIELMMKRFNKDAAKGLNAVIQFELQGEGGGTCHVIIKDETCTVKEGPHPSPSTTISMTAQDYVDMILGELNGQAAAASGRLRILGNLAPALQMRGMLLGMDAATPTSCKEIFELMPARFNKDAAKGLDAVFQFNLSGAGGGSWCAIVKDETCAVEEGVHPSPSATISMTAENFLEMIAGKLDGMVAFMSQKLQLLGDMGLAIRMQSIFGIR